MSFLENQQQIESDCDINFGDRKNEIVLIGQNMNEIEIRNALDACLSTSQEIDSIKWQEGYDDDWPVERTLPIS